VSKKIAVAGNYVLYALIGHAYEQFPPLRP
jgi:hypothetical protein